MEQFDTFYFGTSVTDSINSSNLPKNSLVIDNQQSYGTTYPKQSVHNSKYLKDFKIIKDTNSQLNIEVSLGVLFKRTDLIFDNRNDLIFNNQFIKLQPLIHYFYDNSKTPIPNSLTTIVYCKYMTKLDKRMFVKCLEDKSNLTYLSSNFKSFLYKSFLVTERNNFKNKESFLEYFINNFSKPFFYYPIFGMSDISEHLSRTNAFKGIGYLLQENLEVSKEINTEYGLIKCNTIIPYKLTGKYFCKVIHSLCEEESFFMVTSDCVRIIGLNNLFFHCKEGMIYFVWSDKEITNHIYSVLGVNENEITYDVEFISLLEDECIFK